MSYYNNQSSSNSNILPLYQEIRNRIFLNYIELKQYGAKLRVTRKQAYINTYTEHFRESFIRFYLDLADDAKLGKLDQESKEKLESYYNNIQTVNQKNCKDILDLSRTFIYKLGITKIEYKEKDKWGI